MARKPHDPIEPEVLPGKVPGHDITLSEEAAVKQIEQDQFAMVMQDIGAMRALSFIRKISGRAQVEIYLKLKETKGWKSVPHPDGRKFSDLDELCDVYLGETGRSIRNKVPNYHLLGPALYEVSERMGFKPRDYAALKALPADDQEVIKQAMQPETDREQILDLMQELAVRHASKEAALISKVKEAEETSASRDTLIKNKQARLDQIEEENLKLKRRVETTTPDEAALEIRKEANRIAFLAEHGVRVNLRKAFEALIQHGNVHQHSEYMLGLITQIEFACDVLRGDFGLLKAGPDGDSTPRWQRENAPAAGGMN